MYVIRTAQFHICLCYILLLEYHIVTYSVLLWSLFVHHITQAAANVVHFPHLCGWIFPIDGSLELEQSWYVLNQWSRNWSRCWLSLKLYFYVHSSLNQPAVKFKGRFGLKLPLRLISMKARWVWRPPSKSVIVTLTDHCCCGKWSLQNCGWKQSVNFAEDALKQVCVFHGWA